MVKYFSEVRVW